MYKVKAASNGDTTADDLSDPNQPKSPYLWATVCKTVRAMLSDRCLTVLSVTLVYCDQTVGWIKMKLSVEVGLGPGHTVLDGDPSPLPKGAQPTIFGPCLLWSNGWMDQDATW